MQRGVRDRPERERVRLPLGRVGEDVGQDAPDVSHQLRIDLVATSDADVCGAGNLPKPKGVVVGLADRVVPGRFGFGVQHEGARVDVVPQPVRSERHDVDDRAGFGGDQRE